MIDFRSRGNERFINAETTKTFLLCFKFLLENKEGITVLAALEYCRKNGKEKAQRETISQNFINIRLKGWATTEYKRCLCCGHKAMYYFATPAAAAEAERLGVLV